MANNPIIQTLYFQLLQKHLFHFDKATQEFREIMGTWNLDRAYLLKRIVELRGEKTGPLSKGALDTRHEAKMHSLLEDAMRR